MSRKFLRKREELVKHKWCKTMIFKMYVLLCWWSLQLPQVWWLTDSRSIFSGGAARVWHQVLSQNSGESVLCLLHLWWCLTGLDSQPGGSKVCLYVPVLTLSLLCVSLPNMLLFRFRVPWIIQKGHLILRSLTSVYL